MTWLLEQTYSTRQRILDEALDHALSLLTPGGLLLLFETTTQPAWFESSIGLIEGWSRFEDEWREDNPLLSPEQWKKALETHGFDSVAVWPGTGTAPEILGAHILVAQARFKADIDSSTAKTLLDRENISVVETGSRSVSTDHEGQVTEDSPLIIRQLNEATPDEREMLLIDYIRDTVSKVTRINPANAPDRKQRLMDFGVDSLMAVELRNRLTKGLGLAEPLPATLIFDYPTIEVIARYLVNGMFSEQKTPSSAQEVTNTLAARYAEIKDLSEEETEALLLKKLQDFSDDQR